MKQKIKWRENKSVAMFVAVIGQVIFTVKKLSQISCVISWGASSTARVELQWLNIQLILSSSKLHNALNPLNHTLKRFYSSCHPALASHSSVWPCVFRLPPPLDTVPSEGKVRAFVESQQHKVSLVACLRVYVSISTWLFVGLCCITWTQGKVLNEVLWRKSHVQISGGEERCVDAQGMPQFGTIRK